MTLETPELVSLLAVVLVMVGWLAKLTWMFAQLSVQVETMWDKHLKTWEFLRDRGAMELESKGLGRHQSPISIASSLRRDEILQAFEPIIPELERLAFKMNINLKDDPDDIRLVEAIGTKMGAVLANKICPVLGVFEGGCVTLAISVLRYKHVESE